MRCHMILGIDENATEQEIEQAYQERYDKLCENRELCLEFARGEKIKELQKARNDSLRWLLLTTCEKRSERLQEAGGSLINPALLISSPCHCCRDFCAECKCFSPEVGREIDDFGCTLIVWAGIFLGIVSFGPPLVKAVSDAIISQSEAKEAEKKKELGKQLKETQNMAHSAGKQLKDEKIQYDNVHAFCEFFKAIGCNDCSDFYKRQQGKVNVAKTNFDKANKKVERIRRQM